MVACRRARSTRSSMRRRTASRRDAVNTDRARGHSRESVSSHSMCGHRLRRRRRRSTNSSGVRVCAARCDCPRGRRRRSSHLASEIAASLRRSTSHFSLVSDIVRELNFWCRRRRSRCCFEHGQRSISCRASRRRLHSPRSHLIVDLSLSMGRGTPPSLTPPPCWRGVSPLLVWEGWGWEKIRG